MAEMDLDMCSTDPPFITYLLSQDLTHDCYFIVTNKELVEPVKIGVVKKMLLAHSVVLRNELEDSVIAEKGDVHVDDIYPDTFKNLLKYIYGYDTTAFLSFDEADNLLYTAEKYMMEPLKKRLSTRLMSLLNTENICSLLNNPACFKVIELNCLITEILQCETNKVLASPQFLDISSDALLKIVEQEAMNVAEIDVWRAAIKWAKHQATNESGDILRNQLSKHIKHIRVCSLSHNDFCKEVLPTDILTYTELKLVCLSQDKGEKQAALTEVSNEIEPRFIISPQCEALFTTRPDTIKLMQSTVIIETKTFGIQLRPLKLVANPPSTTVCGLRYQCNCRIKITDITNNACIETLSVVFNNWVECGKPFNVYLIKDNKNVVLLPDKKYTLNISFDIEHPMYCYSKQYMNTYNHTNINEHLSFTFDSNHRSYYVSPVKSLIYRPIKMC